MKYLPFLFLLTLCSSCFQGEDLPPDQEIWEYDDPNAVGLMSDRLLAIDSSIKFQTYERISGLIILKNDKMVFENYYDSTSRNDLVFLDRATISITMAAIGIVLDEGLIALDSPIHQYLPSYESVFTENTEKQKITIRHLLTHRSGISWNERVVPFFGNPDNNLNQMFASSDWVEFILNQPLEAEPGFRYNENTGTGTILARIVQNVTAQPFDQFLNDNLFSAIGVSSFGVGQDPSGNFDGARGASISFIDWAKFGYLMLNEGIWNGRKVIDPNFIAEASTTQATVSNSFNLGLGWWLLGSNFDFLPIDRESIYYIAGDIGQHQYIIPEQRMLIQINAANFFFGFNNPSLNLFINITTTVQ